MKSECPGIEELAYYLYHALSPEEAEQMEGHLVECPTCRRLLALIIKSERAVPDPIIAPKARR